MYHFIADGENAPNIVFAAMDKDIAAENFNVCANNIRSWPKEFAKQFKIKDQQKLITYGLGGELRAVSGDGNKMHSKNISCLILDELHTYYLPKHVELITGGRSSMGAREQPITLITSTAGTQRSISCKNEWDYAEKIRDGKENDKTYLPIIYAAHKDADPSDENTWIAANPNINLTVPIDFFRNEWQAMKQTPHGIDDFRRLYLNQWVACRTRWIDMDCIYEAKQLYQMPDEATRKKHECILGVDISANRDVTAIVANWLIDGVWYAEPHFAIPEKSADNRDRKDLTMYTSKWKDQNLTLTSGNCIDEDFIIAKMKELCGKYDVKCIAYDRYKMTTPIAKMMDEGIECLPVSQGKMDQEPATNYFERLWLNKKFVCNNLILDWMASNTEISTDTNGNKKVVKPTHDSPYKIDGIAAVINACHYQLTQENAYSPIVC